MSIEDDDLMNVFAPFTSEDMKKTVDEMSFGGKRIKFPQGQRKVIRIMAALSDQGETRPWVVIHQHFIKIPGTNKTVVFNCPKSMANERCPACEKYERLMATGNPADEQMARDNFRVQKRAVARAIDRSCPEMGVQEVGLSKTVITALQNIMDGDEDEPGIEFADMANGRDLAITYIGEQPYWYKVKPARHPSPAVETPEALRETVRQMRAIDLKKMTEVLPYEAIVAKISGQAQAQLQGSAGRGPAAIGSSLTDVDEGDDPF